jgi:membrane protein DedA with SNARE-associated domain
VDTIFHLIVHASPLLIYSIVAVDLLLESSGIPVTNTVLLLSVGAWASLGHVNIWLLMLAATVGSVAGACLAYVIGAHGGRQLIWRLAARLHVETQKVDIVERWFQKSGAWMIFLSRMTPYVRPFACFWAGIAGMPFPQFLCAASAGSAIWCVALLSVGWSLGKRWHLALHVLQLYPVPSVCVLLFLSIFYVGVAYLIKRSLTKFSEAEEARVERRVLRSEEELLGV